MKLPYSKNKAVLLLTDTQEPVVFFTGHVLAKIRYIVSKCATEVAWFGFVEEVNNKDFLISDIFIPEQSVSKITADIDADAIVKLAYEHNLNTDNLLYHGHSHVNMPVEPSATDQEHIKDYIEFCPFFIRSISNKNNEMRVDIFDTRIGLTYQNVGYQIWETKLSDEEIQILDNQLLNVKKVNFNTRKANKQHNKPSKQIQLLPSEQDLLDYFDNLSDDRIEQELSILTPEEQKIFNIKYMPNRGYF